jgi:hypothetical protein
MWKYGRPELGLGPEEELAREELVSAVGLGSAV